MPPARLELRGADGRCQQIELRSATLGQLAQLAAATWSEARRFAAHYERISSGGPMRNRKRPQSREESAAGILSWAARLVCIARYLDRLVEERLQEQPQR
jgi:hypothetical protein